MADSLQQVISLIVNKFGDKVKKVQCHAINKLVSLVKDQQFTYVTAQVLREITLFMERPGTKPSHRIYALGFLNKIVGSIAQDDMSVRASALTIYFNLFNKLLGQDPKTNADRIRELKSNRKLSKKQKGKLIAKIEKGAGDVDEEDNKVIELVLKGVNLMMQKASLVNSDLSAVIDKQLDILFRLTHHKVFRIQL